MKAPTEREFVLRILILGMLVAIGNPAFGQTRIPTVESDPILSRLNRVTDESTQVHKLARNIDARLTSMREEFSTFGLSDGNQLMLEETRRTLPSTASSQQRIAWVQLESRWLKLQIMELEQNIEVELHEAVEKTVDHAPLPGEPASLHEMHEYSVALGKLASVHQMLVGSVRSMQSFLDRQLLWVANAHPVSLSDFTQLSGCTTRLGNPRPWLELARRFIARLNSDPWQLGIVVILVIASGVTARRLGEDSVQRPRHQGN